MKTQSVARQCVGDFTLTGAGTIYLFHPLTPIAKNWLETHCPAGGHHAYHGDALAVEHRFVSTIVLQATMDGLQPLKNSSTSTP
jgi:hypothetical protein